MSKQAKQQSKLQRLHGLAAQPAEQVNYALELLDQEHGSQVVTEALSIVSATALPRARPVLLRLYHYCDADGIKRDIGGTLRCAIIAALLPIAEPADLALAEHITQTYEFAPTEKVQDLRAAGLSLLSQLDPVLTGYHCTRLLVDPHTSIMTGEPALSAVRVLAQQAHFLPYQGQLLPLYMHILKQEEHVPEVAAECLRSLVSMPVTLIDTLFALYMDGVPGSGRQRYEKKDDVELAGFFDLLLAHATRSAYFEFIEQFLHRTHRYEVYQYLVAMIIAGHQPDVWDMLLEVAQHERDRQKIEILLAAFALVQHDPIIEELVTKLE